ncbi:MAG: restriction endonuclease subunit S [Candidatus Dadabacteria bacterium]|nr:restriction endonuclease subunit S [Candidatus Dadabacteria bacterium]
MTYEEIKLTKLGNLSTIISGYPFRGKIKEDPNSEVAVVQIKDINTETGLNWENLVRTRLTSRRKPEWLKRGDILFTAHGNRNVAACLNEVNLKAVCSPHLFLIRLRDEIPVLPAFIAWQINQVSAQQYLSTLATGSYITSIRRQVLENLPISVPNISTQEAIVVFHEAAVREKQLLLDMIGNRNRQMRALAVMALAKQKGD